MNSRSHAPSPPAPSPRHSSGRGGVFDPDPSLRWLFCLTHPDDEVSICAWIKRLTSAGAEVFMSWTHSLPRREQEARNVALVLGVPQENLIFHGATDGKVVDEVRDLLPRFREMMVEIKPDRVACGAFEQGHLDHDATNFLVNHSMVGNLTSPAPSPRTTHRGEGTVWLPRAIHSGEEDSEIQTPNSKILEIPFYHPYTRRIQTINRFADPLGEEILELTPMERQLKLQIGKSYPSENVWSVLLWYEIYRGLTFRSGQLRRTERMRPQTHSAFLQPNLPEPLRSKVRESPSWNRWLTAVGPVVLELTQDRASLVRHGESFVR